MTTDHARTSAERIKGKSSLKQSFIVPKKFVERKENASDNGESKRSQKGRGQNKRKDRHFSIETNAIKLCYRVMRGEECTYEQRTGKVCNDSHDIDAFLAAKPADIGSSCLWYNLSGECPYGFGCRFLNDHLLRHDSKLQLKIFDLKKQEYESRKLKYTAFAEKSHYTNARQNLLNHWSTTACIESCRLYLESVDKLKELVVKRFNDPQYVATGESDLDCEIHSLEHMCVSYRRTIYSPEPSFTINTVNKALLAELRTRKYGFKLAPQYSSFLSGMLQKRNERHSDASSSYKQNPENVILCENCDSVLLAGNDGGIECLCCEYKRLFNCDANSEEIQVDFAKPVRHDTVIQMPENALVKDYLYRNPAKGEAVTDADTLLIENCHFGQDADPFELYAASLDATQNARSKFVAEIGSAGMLEKHEHASSYFEARLTQREKSKLDLRGKLYLAPLTTVGNLPFRRLCRSLGADITCSEMVVAESLLKGIATEWARLKRHSSEIVFGAQICGGNVDVVTKASEAIERELDVDFIDLNMGCPLEDVCAKGGGSGLMERTKRVGDMLRGMDYVLEKTPVTAKIRIGVRESKPLAHKIAAKLHGCGVQALTLHGRTKEQRYSKHANWKWIKFVSEVAKEHSNNEMQIIGNGDVLSWQEYYVKSAQCPDLAGIMIGRGALIKPWLFTEIAERRSWDISATERFELMRDFAKFGVEHWGSDSMGLSITRRYLLELQSFSHRYVPLGLLEHLPPLINEKPPPFRGRNELETLLSSPFVTDWIKLTEMIPELGKAPDGYQFTPKHKANSYDSRTL